MQNTRLTLLGDRLAQQLNQLFLNPWRRLSVLIISLLFGNFVASIISTVAGQYANLDTIVAIWVVAFTEVVSWLRYRYNHNRANAQVTIESKIVQRSLWIDLLNTLKIGLIYGLFVEAFKLGS